MIYTSNRFLCTHAYPRTRFLAKDLAASSDSFLGASTRVYLFHSGESIFLTASKKNASLSEISCTLFRRLAATVPGANWICNGLLLNTLGEMEEHQHRKGSQKCSE